MNEIKKLSNKLIELLLNCEDEDFVDDVINRVSNCCPFIEDEDDGYEDFE